MLLTASLVLSPTLSHAQAADPSGHWEGAIQAPNMEVKIEIDLAKNGKGELTGALTNPARNIKGLPFIKVALDGRAITFGARQDQGFSGKLSDDGKTIAGEFGGAEFSIPFTLKRTGPARLDAPPKIAAVSKELEGSWTGTMDVNGTPARVVVAFANHGGTASATMVNVDQGGLTIPVTAMTREGARVSLDLKAVGASYAGKLENGELAGTFTQGAFTAPLTLRKTAAK
jgi:hypothetical protein